MRLGLIEYRGGRIAAFPTHPAGTEKERLWAKGQQGDIVKQRRWLPEEEANAYARLPDFVLIRWGGDESESIQTPPSRPGWHAPRAAHVSEFFQAQEQVAQEPAPVDTPEVAPEFLMSKTGVVHEKGCTYAKRASNPIGFQTLEEAAVHEDFQRYCKCILGDE